MITQVYVLDMVSVQALTNVVVHLDLLDLSANFQSATERNRMNMVSVVIMDHVFHQTIAHVLKDMVDMIVVFQYVLVFLQMVRMYAQQMVIV
jgi:hypothetical protein